MNPDSYSYFVRALNINAVRTRLLGTVGVDLGLAFSQGPSSQEPSARIQGGTEYQHPDWGPFNPNVGVSLEYARGTYLSSALSAGVRIADPLSTNYGPYLNIAGKASFIVGELAANSLGLGGELKLGYRHGHYDVGLTTGLQTEVLGSSLPSQSALFTGLSFTYVGSLD